MKKKAVNEKQGFIERFCSAQENKARFSLILAAALVVVTIGSVCTAAITINSDTAFPSENLELNTAEEFLAKAASESEKIKETEATVEEDITVETSSSEPRETKRGSLTGEHVVDVSDLKSLTNDELMAAIKAGKVGVIDRKDINIDQSENSDAGHKASGGNATATNTPTPVPTNVPTPTLAPITMVNYDLGIDISQFQGNIDWGKVKAAGVNFAFIRCGGRGYTKGGVYDDTKFYTNVSNAKAAGIKVGVYFFSQAITPLEAVEEASITLEKISGLSLDLPVVLDWETGSGYRTADLKGEDFANVITAYCSMIAQKGYSTMVYLNTSDINSRLGSYSGDILSKYKLWYAYPYSCYNDGSMYKAGDTVPPRSFYYEYWQYSWRGKVAGISTDVDLDLRILGKTTLGAPEIQLTNTTITSGAGQAIDPLNGVSAKTSQDNIVTSGITYEIKNASGEVVTLEAAQKTIGKYTITYSFTDSFRGTVTAVATWEVTDAVPTPLDTSPSESSESSESSETGPSEGTTESSETGPSEESSSSESSEETSEETTGNESSGNESGNTENSDNTEGNDSTDQP